jgi:hypothetical protein
MSVNVATVVDLVAWLRALAIAVMVVAVWPAPAMADQCMATFVRDGEWLAMSRNSVPAGAFYRRGQIIALNGGSEDPKIFCQHGGYCAPVADIKFNRPCKLEGDDAAHGGPYYSWYPK